MGNVNAVMVKGAAWKDAELRYTGGGKPMLSLVVAGEQKGVKDDGSPVSSPFYQQVTLFGKQAETYADLAAGTVVVVEGSLEFREWETDGQKRSALGIRANYLAVDKPGEDFFEDRSGGLRLKGGMNQVLVSGRLGADGELRYTASGVAVANARLASTESWKDAGGEWQERTHWMKITAWGDEAVKLAGLAKGDRIFVSGRLDTQSWTDRDQNKRSETLIVASSVEGAAKDANAAATRPAAKPTAAAAPRTSQPAAAATAAKAGAKRQGSAAVLDIDDGLLDDTFPPGGEELPF